MEQLALLQATIATRVGPLQLDVQLAVNDTLVIVGPNGAGKSSLLAALLGALPIDCGKICVGSTTLIDTEAGTALPVEQRGIGYVPQDYALFPHLDVWDNVDFALRSCSPPLDRATREVRIVSLLRELGIEQLARRSTGVLSGGEKQKVALARALSVRPRALLLDEPLAALDVHARREVRGFLAGYLARLGLPTIIVTHDAADTRALGRSIAVLEQGRITQSGSWDDLVGSPATAFVREFVQS
jgi:molybdate transport system ATP-binding protein